MERAATILRGIRITAGPAAPDCQALPVEPECQALPAELECPVPLADSVAPECPAAAPVRLANLALPGCRAAAVVLEWAVHRPEWAALLPGWAQAQVRPGGMALGVGLSVDHLRGWAVAPEGRAADPEWVAAASEWALVRAQAAVRARDRVPTSTRLKKS